MKQCSTLVFMFLLALGMQAQTLVNRAWKASTGSPTLTYDYLAGYTGTGYVILVGNTYSPGQSENYLISKYSFAGQLLWQTEYNSENDLSDIGFDIYIKGNGVYVTGTAVDSATVDSDILSLKLSLDSGIIQWDTAYAGSYGGNDVAVGIVADNAGNAYVLGSEQTDYFQTRMAVIKYDAAGQQLWTSSYDSAGYIDVAGAIEISDTDLIITGVSGQGFGSWHFVTLTASANTGTITAMRLDPNGNGGLEQLYSVSGHSSNNIYIAGSILNSPANEDIKIVCYDTLLNEKWTRTWGSPDSLMDRPSKIAMNGAGHMVVLGESRKPGGGSDMVLLCYHNSSGSLLWERRLSAPNPAHSCKPADIVGVPDALGMPTYIAGSVYNGTDYDYLTASYDVNGNLRWIRTMDDTLGSDDLAKDIQYVSGGVIVSGTSTMDSSSKYVSVRYEELALSKTTVDDTVRDVPLYLKNQVLFKVNRAAVKEDAVNKVELLFGDPEVFLETWAVDSLKKKLPFGDKQWKLARVFTGLRTTDTVSISRLGEEVPIPDFWSTFLLVFPPNIIAEQRLCDTLNQLFPFVEHAELDLTAVLTDARPNDIAFEHQLTFARTLGLVDDFPNAHINVEQAWEYTAGKPYVKVGIFDSGLLLSHQDFHSSFNFGPDVGEGPIAHPGWDFMHQTPLNSTPYTTDYGDGHGTKMAGIIGAVRNNSIGIAGIAGGDSAVNPGASLYGFRVFEQADLSNCTSNCGRLAAAHNFANGIVRTTARTPDSTYGFGMNILNQSIVFTRGASYETDSGYRDDNNVNLILDAYRFAHRNKVTMPSSTGNEGLDYIYYPAGIDDAWILAVGGTGHAGGYVGLDYEHDEFFANYGVGIDIGAPAVSNLTYTTAVTPNNDLAGGYTHANGTSSAAAHASGVAALLMSYLNDSTDNINNLAPEDVEYVVQRSAFNVDTPGYDLLTGYGRLNAGGALSIVDVSKRRLLHFDSDFLPHDVSIGNVAASQAIKLSEKEKNIDEFLFDGKGYKADIYKVTCEVQFPEILDDSIVATWERHSSSFTYPYITDSNKLVPRERIILESFSNTGYVASGYVYKIYDSLTNQALGWLPFDTTHAKDVNFAVTALVGDTIYSPWDTLVNISNIYTNDVGLAVYPNPSNNAVWIKASSDCQGNVKMSMANIQGQEILAIFNGDMGTKEKLFHVNMDNIQSGLYFVQLVTECGTVVSKLVKNE